MSGAAEATRNTPDLETVMGSFDPANPESLQNLEQAMLLASEGGHLGAMDEVPTDEGEGDSAAVAPAAAEPKAADAGAVVIPEGEKPVSQEETPPATAGATPGTKPEANPVGIAAKDGAHIIPYSVLARERERANAAEELVRTQADELQRLQAGGKPSTSAPQMLSDAELEQLEQDLPAVAAAIRSQQALLQQLAGTVSQMRESNLRTEEQQRVDEESAAIAASQSLSALKAAAYAENASPADVARWNRTADQYATLRGDPQFFHLSTAELIGKAEQLVTVLLGPSGTAPSAAPAPASQQRPNPSVKDQADAIVAAQQQPVPLSLSEFPGGAAAAQSDIQKIAGASILELDRMMRSMTPEQVDAYIARVGI